MSHAAIKAAIEKSQAEGAAMLVHLALAYHANRKHIAWPGVALLAKETRLTERGVQRGLRQLKALGEIGVKYKQGPHGCNLYTLNLVHSEPGSRCISLTETLNKTTGNPEPRSPKPSKNHQKPSKKSRDPYGVPARELALFLYSEHERVKGKKPTGAMGRAIGDAKRLLKAEYPGGPPESLNGERAIVTAWLERWNDDHPDYPRTDWSMTAFVERYRVIENWVKGGGKEKPCPEGCKDGLIYWGGDIDPEICTACDRYSRRKR